MGSYVDALLPLIDQFSEQQFRRCDFSWRTKPPFDIELSKRGRCSPADRAYIAQVVAARSGVRQSDADKRVSDVITQAKTAMDNARKAVEHLAIWLTISLLVGAFCGSLAATEGGGLRDGTWNY
jgi:hypothetical protein